MTSSRLAAALALAAAACGSSKKAAPFQVVAGDNVLAVSVSGAGCGSSPYQNEPCVSVKVCAPGSTTSCQVIGGLLLDTGSYGLRVFRQALPAPLLSALPAVQPPGGGSLAECVKYADLSADWGPVVSADVVLGNEPAVNVPIQVIDATYGAVPSTCPSPETAPTSFNGILGVGPFVPDCSDVSCPASAGMYFSWSGTAMTAIDGLPPAYQVQNPVGLLPGDGNGIIVALPGVPDAGAPSVQGAVVLGIGTRTNNQPRNANAIPLDGGGDFTTVLGGTPMPGSFADTGSNGFFFDASTITTCQSQAAQGWYCPPSPVSFSATNRGTNGGHNQLGATFQVGNIETLSQSGNGVFANIAGPGVAGGGFDWGLPFFLGKTVYLQMAGRSSDFGTGPLLAY